MPVSVPKKFVSEADLEGSMALRGRVLPADLEGSMALRGRVLPGSEPRATARRTGFGVDCQR